jgi:hypothetical protein
LPVYLYGERLPAWSLIAFMLMRPNGHAIR